jgi:nicotinamide-nucleotide amidase
MKVEDRGRTGGAASSGNPGLPKDLDDSREPYGPIGLEGLCREVGEGLLRRGWTLALAESCTGGWVCKLLTDVPGSSRYLLGGVVAYADRVKSKVLEVDPGLLARHGAVSGEVAVAMAVGVSRSLGADVALSITGIAGPGGGVPGKPVGTVWFGLLRPGLEHTERVRFDGDRERVRMRAATHALELLRSATRDEPGGSGAGRGQNPSLPGG